MGDDRLDVQVQVYETEEDDEKAPMDSVRDAISGLTGSASTPEHEYVIGIAGADAARYYEDHLSGVQVQWGPVTDRKKVKGGETVVSADYSAGGSTTVPKAGTDRTYGTDKVWMTPDHAVEVPEGEQYKLVVEPRDDLSYNVGAADVLLGEEAEEQSGIDRLLSGREGDRSDFLRKGMVGADPGYVEE